MGEEKVDEAVKAGPGQTVRRLNFRDRQLIILAAQQYASRKNEEANHKALRRLARLQEILNSDEVDEWYETIEAHHRHKLSQWREREEKRLKGEQNGLPPERPPKLTAEEIAGPERDFVISTTLDSWIIESLKAARFPTEAAKWVDLLYSKYGFTEDP